jgi:hypothetical protein
MAQKEFTGFAGAFARSGAEQWLSKSELQQLHDLLRHGESVEFLVYAKVVVSTRLALSTWLIALTSARLLCVKGGNLHSRRVIDIPLVGIVSVAQLNRLLSTEVVVATSHGRIRIVLARDKAAALADALMRTSRAVTPAPTYGPTPLIADPRTDPVLGASERDRSRIELLEETVDQLEQDLSAVRQQVDFLEELLKTRLDPVVH